MNYSIVFVHGLFGHPYETWMSPSTNLDQSSPDNGGGYVQTIEKPTHPSVFKRPFQLFTSKHKATQYGIQVRQEKDELLHQNQAARLRT